jgi:hypothetical protein
MLLLDPHDRDHPGFTFLVSTVIGTSMVATPVLLGLILWRVW